MPSITSTVIAAGIGAAGSLASGAMNSSATSSAAQTEANAANASAQVQQNMYNTTRSDLAPFLTTGQGALAQLSSLLGIGGSAPNSDALNSALQNYPGYQFAKQQGLQAVNESGAARGLLNSGATIKNATTFGQGLANSTFGSYMSGLGSLASLGESAGSITGNAGNVAGGQIGNSLMAAGSATGAGQLGSSLALSGGINSALNSASLQAALMQSGGGSSNSWANVSPYLSNGTGGYGG